MSKQMRIAVIVLGLEIAVGAIEQIGNRLPFRKLICSGKPDRAVHSHPSPKYRYLDQISIGYKQL